MVSYLMQDLAGWMVGMTHWADTLQMLHWHLPIELLAYNRIDVDLMGDAQKVINNFIKTGQVWAFLIGIVFGYLVKTFTTYG